MKPENKVAIVTGGGRKSKQRFETVQNFRTVTELPNGKVLIADSGNSELWDPKTASSSPTGYMGVPADGSNNGLCDPKRATCSPAGSMGVPLGPKHTATLLGNGKVLIAARKADCAAELYDPATGMFRDTGSMKNIGVATTATLLPDGTVFIMGLAPSAEIYDPETETFSTLEDPKMDGGASMLLPNGKVLIAGSVNPGSLLDDPATKHFTPTDLIGRGWNYMTLLPNGNVFLVASDCAGIYNPTTDIFSTIADKLYLLPGNSTATLLPNGKVLLLGSNTSAPAVFYDYKTRAFSPAKHIFSPGWGHSATLLSDGKVLVTEIPGTTTEILDPAIENMP